MKNNNTAARFALIFFAIFSIVLAPVAAGKVSAQVVAPGDYPVQIWAPSIKLNSPIQGVGTTSGGAMAVPSGRSNNVGWYKYGVVPGRNGTAVLDAHVFAAFKNLDKIKPGGDIYIVMHSGKVFHYVVTASRTYALSALSSSTLFAPTSAEALNLITCAGSLTTDRSTYDHRLIVSARLM